MLQLEDTESLLNRLSQKAGVQSTLVLERETGAVVRMSGAISTASSLNSSQSRHESTTISALDDTPTGANKEPTKAEEVASMVWGFINTASGLVTGLDGDDEVKLLRLRTKKNELVIVPGEWTWLLVLDKAYLFYVELLTQLDSKFILIVIHDTPPA